ncbi:MAG: phage holin family protein [Micromonosporaceae bacterium]|nr:phage holin family protein [Micromonosporaceae bacterium]
MNSTNGRDDGRRDDLGRLLAEDVLEVGRQELVRLREDLVGQVRPATTGILMLAAGGAGAMLALGVATTAALRLLELVLPRRIAALALTGGYLAGSAVLVRLGLDKLSAAGGGSQRLADGARHAGAAMVSQMEGAVAHAGTHGRPGTAR